MTHPIQPKLWPDWLVILLTIAAVVAIGLVIAWLSLPGIVAFVQWAQEVIEHAVGMRP